MDEVNFLGFEVRPHHGPITVKSDEDIAPGAWCAVEKVEHDGVMELRRTGPHSLSLYSSARLSDCCCEGPVEHMQALCEAIQAGEGCSFKRCAVEPFEHPEHGAGFVFWSPRNDHKVVGWVPYEHAKAMADDFLEEVTRA